MCIVQPDCSHAVCIPCFRRCRFDGPPRINEPQFPYPDKEDEYFDDIGNVPENPLFHDPLVLEYNRLWNQWDNDIDAQYAREENLRKCPICRA